MILKLLVFGFLLHTAIAPVYAQDDGEQNVRPAILDVNYERLESQGLYSSPADGSLGRDLWSNTPRSAIVSLLPKIQSPGYAKVVQDLTFGLLLSASNPRLIENDIEIEPGMDLLTLRLFKLMEIGAPHKALQLYSELNQEPYHPRLAKAGILALLFNAEKSLACLEYKIVEDRAFEGEFWKQINLYCSKVLEDAQVSEEQTEGLSSAVLKNALGGGRYSVPYAPEKMRSLTLEDLAFLTAENAISYNLESWSTIKAIAPEHLMPALKQNDLSDEQQFLLKMRAVRLGFLPLFEWKDLYDTYDLQKETFNDDLIDIDSLPDWKKFLGFYYNIRKAKNDGDKWKIFEQAYSLAESYNIGALYPFAELLSGLSPQDLSQDMMVDMAVLLHFSNTRSRHQDLYTQALISRAKTIKTAKPQKSLVFIIEIIDNTLGNVHNAPNIYEKDFDLTFSDSYVMPSREVWNILRLSGQNQSIGHIALLSTLVLQKQDISEMYPGLVADIIENLNATGLNRVSKELIYEALLYLLTDLEQ